MRRSTDNEASNLPPTISFSLSHTNTCTLHTSLQVSSSAASLGVNTHIVRDAGRTQIAAGSKTVLCVGPGESTALLGRHETSTLLCEMMITVNTYRSCFSD